MSCSCGATTDDNEDVIPMYRGDTLEMSVQARRVDPRSGAILPYNLTGAKVWITIKRAVDDGDTAALAQVSTVSSTPVGGSVTIDPAPESGWLDIVVPPAATLALPAVEQWLVYDVQLLDQLGRVKTILKGRIQILPDVTVTEV